MPSHHEISEVLTANEFLRALELIVETNDLTHGTGAGSPPAREQVDHGRLFPDTQL